VLVFEVARKPSWATFDPATGKLDGTPPAGTTGTYTGIVIFASDGELKTALPASPRTVIQNLAPRARHFALSAYTKNGAKSSKSAVVSKVIG
jgi:hypothetical protein